MEQVIGKEVETTTEVNETPITEKPKKLNSIDLCKFIMAICVVAIHTSPWLDFSDNVVLCDIIKSFVGLAVPFFFIASAYFLFSKMKKVGNGDIRSEESLKVLKDYSLRMLKLYFIWQLIYLPSNIYQMVVRAQAGQAVGNLIFSYFKDMIFFVVAWDSFHLWYLWASCITSFVIYLMLKLKFKTWLLILISFAIYFFGRGLRMFVGMKGQFDGILLTLANVVEWLFGADYTVKGFVYFPIALMLVLNPIKNLKWYKLLPLFMAVFSIPIVVPYITDFALVVTAVEEVIPIVSQGLFFMLILTISLKDAKAYFYLRKYSMVIYLVHNFFSIMLKAFVLDYGILLFVIVTIISLLIAIVVTYFAENKKVKWLRAILN